MRGGIELRGMVNLQKFVEEGGLFITIGSVSEIPIDYGITNGISVETTRQLQARGSVFNATFADKKSPIAYGYGDSLPVYFNQAPVFNVNALGGGFGGGGGGGGGGVPPGQRPSGRGTLTDPDIVQSMPQAGQRPQQQTRPGEEGIPEEIRQFAAAMIPPMNMRPRIVLRFNSNAKELLISGMLAGESELAGKPAVVDVPVGKGH